MSNASPNLPMDDEVLASDYDQDVEVGPKGEEASAPSPFIKWETKQRELVTSVVDYNLSTLLHLVNSGTIDVSPKYQRRFRWDAKRQSRLIESFLMNVPVPPVYLNEDDYGSYSVIDGKQRLLAIKRFLSNHLKLTGLDVFRDINGMTFSNLPPTLQAVLSTRPTLRAVIVLRQSDDDVKFEVFQRLNTGGVRLNPQEIRNSTYPGPLNDLILDLSVNPLFHRLLGISNPEKSAIYQEMRDAEFVLRFMTFQDNWETFSGGMKQSMDSFMSKNQRASQERLDSLRASFVRTLEVVDAAFGEHAFQRWQPSTESWRKQVLAALFDAEMFASQYVNLHQVRGNQEAILTAVMNLFSHDSFRQSIDAATNTPSSFRSRIRIMRDTLEQSIRD